MCAGVAWLKPKGFAKPWSHGLPLAMVGGPGGLWQRSKKKGRVGASECVPLGQLRERKNHGYLTGLAWVRGARVAIQSLLSSPGWVVWECVP